ncbi:hypothetical protein A5630_25300 [Mycolicibacterium mucogenicum]|uniref:Uncharacterized protein n=1 Tax=Mycolicibacterium mucogenicum TaxID=56689 RepID=A0A1A3GWR5_MYCMU|nr:hypothetical protein [Mycolicibacterium mucogenicum]OBJ40270.1 hypothetical protein A5630_25300 [Mycolicibacterium mucogenicum]
MALNWYTFAQEDDIHARDFYESLILAKSEGFSWVDTWVEVPRKVLHQIRRGYDEDQPVFWNGLEWVDVFVYETQGHIYARLPQPHEVSE